jgi:hypothetical protein
MGYDLTETVRGAILGLPQSAWRPAVRQPGGQRDGAWVAEITEHLDLTTWPDGTRVIVRRERPHPGAQLSFTDHDGHRFLATITDLKGDPVELERLHRARANAEDRVPATRTLTRPRAPPADDHTRPTTPIAAAPQTATNPIDAPTTTPDNPGRTTPPPTTRPPHPTTRPRSLTATRY